MIHQNTLPENLRILQRDRIDSLISIGLQHPLLLIYAGPGYGKTQSMSDYLSKHEAEIIWLRLGSIDNITGHFWRRLVSALEAEYPQYSELLESFDFPDSISSFEVFAQFIETNLISQKQTIWVFDDYGAIDNRQIRDFIQILVEANFKNFHIVLLSNKLESTEYIAFMTTRRALILADDLRFNKNEIAELYRINDIALGENELDAIERYTEGWSLPLCLLATQTKQTKEFVHQGKKMTPIAISHMFEERFFLPYPEQQRKLMINLSTLDFFSESLISSVCDTNGIDYSYLRNHAFLMKEPSGERFYLHKLYRDFLEQKKNLLPAQEQKDFWQNAAKSYMESGDMMEAITFFSKAGDNKNMLLALHYAAVSQDATNDKTAEFFLKHINLLTPEELQQNPKVDCIRAFIYLTTYQLSKAETLITELEQRLINSNTYESRIILGETFVIHGLLSMMQAKEDFGYFYEKAAKYLGKEHMFSGPNELKVFNHYSFFMTDNKKGAKERMEKAVHSGVPWMTKVMNGRNQNKYKFSVQWLDLIQEQTEQFIKRANNTRAKYTRNQAIKIVKNNPLSKREIAVLQSMANGMTREEIALEQYISVGTVKAAITSIYCKLGANNKGDAISIAMKKGYI